LDNPLTLGKAQTSLALHSLNRGFGYKITQFSVEKNGEDQLLSGENRAFLQK
jgi:hypothetical protein